MTGLDVDTAALAAAGQQVATAGVSASLPAAVVVPAANDAVSIGVAQTLSARIATITTHSAAGGAISATAGAVIESYATSYATQESANAAALRIGGGPPEGVAPASAVADAAPNRLTPMSAPPMPAGITPTDGKMIAEPLLGEEPDEN